MSPKNTVVTVVSGSSRLPVSVTFQSASRSRVAVASAAPSTVPMLNTRTSGRSGSAGADVVVGVVVVVTAAIDESSPSSDPPPIVCNAMSRNATPRNNSTMMMARRGRPEESRWFIGAYCIDTR